MPHPRPYAQNRDHPVYIYAQTPCFVVIMYRKMREVPEHCPLVEHMGISGNVTGEAQKEGLSCEL